MRILITITPRMYREVLALSIHRRRPDFEVLLAPPWSLDGKAERFGPHVLVQGPHESGLPPELPDGVLCRIQLLDNGRMDATIELVGTASEVHDVCLEDLFEVLEEAESLSKGTTCRTDPVVRVAPLGGVPWVPSEPPPFPTVHVRSHRGRR